MQPPISEIIVNEKTFAAAIENAAAALASAEMIVRILDNKAITNQKKKAAKVREKKGGK